ncbi:MAG: hypothetical protein WA866_05265, partial [Pseudolabrys sp.]
HQGVHTARWQKTKEEGGQFGGRFYASGSALKRSGANDMNLDSESEGIVMRAARLAPYACSAASVS